NATDLADLFSALVPAQLGVSPSSALSSGGSMGGPFSPNSQTYTLTNSGGTSLGWAATNTANWFTVSPSAGSLAPGSSATVSISINANANSLAANTYFDTVSFINLTNGAGNTTRSVSLTVNSAATQLSVSPTTGLSSSGP